MKPLPNIIITSYLGNTPKMRKLRLGYHLEQRRILRELFNRNRYYPIIKTLASDYTQKEMNQLIAQIQEESSYQGVVEVSDYPKMMKWELQNIWLKRLYERKKLTNILFLDDDIVPREPKEDDAANGMVDCAKLIQFWLENPDQMMAPMAYFASVGLRFDAFYKKQKVIVGEAPVTVMSWAMMMRSDLNVLYTRDLVMDEKTGLYDDVPFRIKCWAEGKPVVKHGRAFFRTLQKINKTEGESTWFKNQEERIKTNEVTRKRMLKMFPGFFSRNREVPTGEIAKVKRTLTGDK